MSVEDVGADLCDSRNHFSPNSDAASSLVLRNVGDNQPEIRCQCDRYSASPRTWKLPDSMGMVASFATSDGSSGARKVVWNHQVKPLRG